ncbi:MAG: PAS domain S-box protein [Calditrichaeota bacterium]|nr:PAS domain S-box protein [Calditrichota bacterium]
MKSNEDAYASLLNENERLNAKIRQLESQNIFFKTISDNSPDLVYVFSIPQKCVIYCSDRLLEILGYTFAEVQEMGERFFSNITHPDEYQEIKQHLERLNASRPGEHHSIEFRAKHKNGTWRWMRSRDVVRKRDENNATLEILGVAEDITEWKKSQSTLVSSEAHFRMLVEASPYTIIIVDEQGIIRQANKRTKVDFGYLPPELIGQSVESLIPDNLRHSHEKYRKIYTKSPFSRPMGSGLALEAVRKDGSKFPVEIALTPIQLDQKTMVLTTIVDITQRRKAEIMVKRSAERIRLLYDVTAKSSHDEDRRITNALKLVTRLLGMEIGIQSRIYPDEDLYIIENLYSPETQLRTNQSFSFKHTCCEITLANEDVTTFEDLKLSQYSEHPCYKLLHLESYIGVPIRVQNKVYGTISFSSYKPRPIAFDYLDVDLMRLLAEWIGATIDSKKDKRALRHYTVELENKNRELEEFSYIASHDLREPLRTIISFCNILENDIGERIAKEAQEDIAFITDAAKRMINLIENLLEYSRAGRVELKLEPVDLNRCIEGIVDNLKALTQETGAVINFEQLPTVQGDSTLLAQVFQNLISNSLKFHGSEPPYINISAEPLDNSWVIQISDNGIGIAAEHAEQVFKPFRRLHSQGKYKGTGIGLSICKKIIERHGGYITIQSEPGKGSTFSIFFK